MNIPLVIRTVSHLKMTQVYYQVRKRFVKPRFESKPAPIGQRGRMSVECIPKYRCWDGKEFTFLNLRAPFKGWNDDTFGALWCYNLNYMDWLGQEGLEAKDGLFWIDRFIAGIPTTCMGLDPYPIALRSINWIKFFFTHPESVNGERENSLYSQLKLLEKKLEYHLLGNHLLEDAYALYIGAVYFNDGILLKRAQKLLYSQLKEQILGDGAHFEQSPMYHCILLDRLLDCINFRKTVYLCDVAEKMLGHLESIIWEDKSIPLFNDAAYGIAPQPKQLFDYAKRLGLNWRAVSLGQSGYRRLSGNSFEAIIDVGEITAKYQPGHSQADTFSYELRIDGQPVIIDTGISTYNKTARRQYERSTVAHNTVSVDEMNSNEVWGGFRVGRQARVDVQTDEKNHIVAAHNGFGAIGHTREFVIDENQFGIKDKMSKPVEAVNYIHLAPGVTVLENDGQTILTNKCRIVFDNALSIKADRVEVSSEYNKFNEVCLLKVTFKGQMSYRIEK